MSLTDALAAAEETFLVYLRRPQSDPRLAAVFRMATLVAHNSPTFGTALVDVGSLNAAEAILVGSVTDVDAVLLSSGEGLSRRRLASYHLDAVDDPLEMLVAWGLDR